MKNVIVKQGATRHFYPIQEIRQRYDADVEGVQLRLISSLTIFELTVLHILLDGDIEQSQLEMLANCSRSELTACIIKLSTLEKHPCYEDRDGGKVILGCL